MPAKHSRHIALTGPLAEWAERQVTMGEYTSLSDLIRTAIRLLKVQDEGRHEASSLVHERKTSPPEADRIR